MYLDSSVLLKLYVPEPDSAACVEKVTGSALGTSELAYGEIRAALLAKERGKEISAQQRDAAWARLLDDISERVVTLFPLNFVTVRDATDVMEEVHPHVPLRTLDAIHVATFRAVNAGPMFTNDKRMRAAAKFLELTIVE